MYAEEISLSFETADLFNYNSTINTELKKV